MSPDVHASIDAETGQGHSERTLDGRVMDDDEIKRTLLWLGIEDYSGLWEAVWELNTRAPEEETSNAALARRSLQDYLRQGWIELFECEEPEGDLRQLSTTAAMAALQRDGAWKEPAPGTRSIRFSTTPKGESAYAELGDSGHW